MSWSDGSIYVGAFKDGLRHGKGKFSYPDGSMYEGEWKNDEPNGQGTETSHDGRKYIGKWKDGLRHGKGTMSWSDGKRFVGGNGRMEIFGMGKDKILMERFKRILLMEKYKMLAQKQI